MRLYKLVSPILLIAIIAGFLLNTSSLSNISFGRNNVNDVAVINKGNDILAASSVAGNRIVEVAYKEIGNIGGEKYWSWYGYNTRASWCCSFISWCADQCGYIESGIIPKFAGVSYGWSWFIEHDEWVRRDECEVAPGMIVFFDFVNSNLEDYRDGHPDHVGIVKTVKDGYVYCIEGNYNDMCVENRYAIDSYNILGYGTPNY